jgi:membrane AbrB-like protein
VNTRLMLRAFLPALVLALGAAQLCVWLDTPLPWMIGPLFSTAAACMMGARLGAPVQAREAGQWAIGTVLGLYFSAPVMAVLARYAPWIVLAVVFALVLGMAGAWLLQRVSDVDPATAFFALAVGGASEMAVQGERHGALIERVAAPHRLRIRKVVGTIPFAVRWWSEHGLGPGRDLFAPAASVVDPLGLVVLVGATCLGALVL